MGKIQRMTLSLAPPWPLGGDPVLRARAEAGPDLLGVLAQNLQVFPPVYFVAALLYRLFEHMRARAIQRRVARASEASSAIPRFIQLAPSSVPGDGVTQSMLYIAELLAELGYASQVHAGRVPPALRDHIRPLTELTPTSADWLFYHHAVGSPLGDYLIAWPGNKLLIYHNITPPEFFAPNHPWIALLRLGREQLQHWRCDGRFMAVLADSRFNADELRQIGYSRVAEIPLLLDPARWMRMSWDQSLVECRRHLFTVLFVGRIVENKRQIELVALFDDFRRACPRPCELVLVGDTSSQEYARRLRAEIERRKLQGYVTLAGRLPDSDLVAVYRSADAYVSLSAHEGFGMPLVEAVALGVPVLAQAAGAVAETLGSESEIFPQGASESIVQALLRLATDPNESERVRQRQRSGLSRYERARVRGDLAHWLGTLGVPPPGHDHLVGVPGLQEEWFTRGGPAPESHDA